MLLEDNFIVFLTSGKLRMSFTLLRMGIIIIKNRLDSLNLAKQNNILNNQSSIRELENIFMNTNNTDCTN